MTQLTILPFKKNMTIRTDESVMQALRRGGYEIEGPCNGQGICGKCRIRVENSADVPQTPHRRISEIEAHEQGIRLLVDLLVAGGSKRFLVLSGPTESDVGNERRTIALRHLARHGFEDVPVLYGDFSYQSGKDCFARWMKDHDAPDAVICSNDTMAIGCIDQARDGHGIRVPEELSVTGFDGIHAAFWTGYDLTTVRQPVNQMAKAAVDILMERVENPETPPEKRVLAGSLFKGSSVRS